MKVRTIAALMAVLLPLTPAMASRNHNSQTMTKHRLVGTNINDLVREVYKQRQLTMIDNIQFLSQSDRHNAICLALSVYHEARSSSKSDELSVAFVGINRLKANGEFGNSLCEVINQRLPNTTIPQYSWLKSRLGNLIPKEKQSWIEAQEIAYRSISSSARDPSHGATFFWNTSKSRKQPWMKGGKAYYNVGHHVYMVATN